MRRYHHRPTQDFIIMDTNIVGFGVSMNKEQAAIDHAQNKVEISDGLVESLQCKHVDELFSVIRNTFIAGAKWREEQAASGFEEWRSAYVSRIDGYNNMIGTGTLSRDAWQAAHLSSAKLLAEKDAEIAELKKKTGFKTGFYVRECNNCGHDWSRDD